MSFESGNLVSNAIQRIRLVIGDIAPEQPILDDSVYNYLLAKNGADEDATAIEALENIINYYSLSPTSEVFGPTSGLQFDIKALERQLVVLKARRYEGKYGIKTIPVVIRAKRSNWDDFDSIFGE